MPDPDIAQRVLYRRMESRLRLRHLRLLVSLDACLALGAAAQRIGISQPAATQMLRELEQLLEIQLYERHSKGLRPTEAGRQLASYARLALGNMEQAADALAASAFAREATLHLGGIQAAIQRLLVPVLNTLQQRLPHLRLSVLESSHDTVMAQLNAGSLQVALIRAPAPGTLSDALQFTPLRSDRLAIIASPQHPLAGAGPQSLPDLADYAWSLPAPHQPAGQVFEAACEAAGLVPRRSSLQSVSTSLLCQITQDHHTLAALPHAIVGQLLEQGLLVELPLHTPLPLPALGALHGHAPSTSALGQLLSTLQLLHAA